MVTLDAVRTYPEDSSVLQASLCVGQHPQMGPGSMEGAGDYSCHQMTTEFAFLFLICGTAARIPPVYLSVLSQHGPSRRFEKPFQRMPFFLTTACVFLSLTLLGK